MNALSIKVSVSTEKNYRMYDPSPTKAYNCVEDITYADEISNISYWTGSKFKNEFL